MFNNLKEFLAQHASETVGFWIPPGEVITDREIPPLEMPPRRDHPNCLYWYDGPLMFLSTIEGNLVLACEHDMRPTADRSGIAAWYAVELTPPEAEAMLQNKVSLYHTFRRRKAWYFVEAWNNTVKGHWVWENVSLPDAILPDVGVFLDRDEGKAA